MKQLREYQEAAIKSLFKYLFENSEKHPLVVAPVAAGKSLLIAEFIRRVHALYPRTRIVVLTSTKELLVQNSQELDEQYFGCDFGFYCASLNQKRLHNDVTFASIQSVYNKIGDFNRAPEIIICDECHLISHKEATTYRKFFASVLAINPNCRIIGLTGTPFRADTGRLDDGHNRMFDGIAYEIGMDYMIEQGFWAKPVCPEIATKIDATGVSVRGGDYVVAELESKINTHEINDACVKELVEKGVNRRKWLVFTAGVKHAFDVADEIRRAGISVEVVTGETPAAERDRIIEAFRRGEFRCLVNVAVLTTGFNVPDIDLLVFMRPTKSPVLYVQMTGRGVRPVYAAGFDLSTKDGRLEAIAASIKPDCMIMDFGRVVESLGPVDQVSIKKKYDGEKPKGDGEAIMKICPSCGAECFAAQRYCYACSYCFIELSQNAANNAIVSRDIEPEWVEVFDTYFDRHQKEGGQPTMKVSYYTMRGVIREWVCFEHHVFEPGDKRRFGWNRAVEWHNARLESEAVPNTIEDALARKYPKPLRIFVRKKGEYYDVLDYEFPETVTGGEAALAEETRELIKEEDYFEIAF